MSEVTSARIFDVSRCRCDRGVGKSLLGALIESTMNSVRYLTPNPIMRIYTAALRFSSILLTPVALLKIFLPPKTWSIAAASITKRRPSRAHILVYESSWPCDRSESTHEMGDGYGWYIEADLEKEEMANTIEYLFNINRRHERKIARNRRLIRSMKERLSRVDTTENSEKSIRREEQC